MRSNTIPLLPSRFGLIGSLGLLVCSIPFVVVGIAAGSTLVIVLWVVAMALMGLWVWDEINRRRYWRTRVGFATATRALRPAVRRLTPGALYRNAQAGVVLMRTRVRFPVDTDRLNRVVDEAVTGTNEVLTHGHPAMLTSDTFTVVGRHGPVLHHTDVQVVQDAGPDGLMDLTPPNPPRSKLKKLQAAVGIMRSGGAYASEDEIREVLAQLDGAAVMDLD